MPDYVVQLQPDLTPFLDAFNRNQDKPRFVSILSPTCKDCVIGAKAIQKHLVEAFPDLDMTFLIVWSPVVKTDMGEDLLNGIQSMKDPRVQHFWDPGLLLGKELKKHLPLGRREFAWDIYLFFDEGKVWSPGKPPRVFAWSHQLDALDAKDADPEFLRLGDRALGKMFRDTVARLAPR